MTTTEPRTADSLAREARLAAAFAGLVALFHAACGVLRYRTYSNQTFDLAFYSRMAWGMARFDFWDPILGTHVFGLHLAPVLVPIGWVGALGSTPIALYLAQGLAVALATYPLARVGQRAFGRAGAFVGAFALVLHPNLGHVLAYEAHPGTLAVLPLAWLAYAIDHRSARAFVLASLGVLACREDLALLVVLGAFVLAASSRAEPAGAKLALRRAAAGGFTVAVLWLGLFVLVLHPMYRPAAGSMEAHFGGWGRSAGEVVQTILTEPGRVLAHLAAPKRLTYLPRILGPLCLLPLLAPRALFVASPVLAIALLSFFSTTTRIDSHYLTPAIPILVWGAFDGARVLKAFAARRGPNATRAAARLPAALGLASLGGTFVSGLFSPLREPPPFVTARDEDVAAFDRMLARIPARASVEAPDAFLPHVAERPELHRPTTFVRDVDALVLDLSHRSRFRGTEDLLRTTEEPRVRTILARDDLRLADRAGDYVLLVRDRASPARRIAPVRLDPHDVQVAPTEAIRLCECLAVLGASYDESAQELLLDFVASGPCPNDLAIRIGRGGRSARVDLLFDGLVSPIHLREGDVVRSVHLYPRSRPLTRGALRPIGPVGDSIELGALRSSGARPAPDDPISVRLPLARVRRARQGTHFGSTRVRPSAVPSTP